MRQPAGSGGDSRGGAGSTRGLRESGDSRRAAGESLANEPFLISQLCRWANLRTALSGLEQALSRRRLEEADLLSLQAALGSLGAFDGMSRALAGERSMSISLFEASPEELLKVKNLASDKAVAEKLAGYQKTPKWQEDYVFMLDYYEGLSAALEKPITEARASFRAAQERITNAVAKGYLLSTMTIPAMGGAFDKAVDTAAMVLAAQTTLSVEQYRLKHENALPSTLDALVPEFLPSIPADPYDGKPLRYLKLPGKGYVVYSVGKDLRDNRGAMAPPGAKGEVEGVDVPFAVRR